MMRRGQPEAWVGGLLILGAVGFILPATLLPASQAHAIAQDPFCIICGHSGLANILRNILLFVPLGMGLSLLIRSPVMAWIPTLLLTLGIETAQMGIPGRNPLLIDVVANAAGGAVGIAFIQSLRSSVREPSGSTLARAWVALPFLVFVFTGWALQLAPPEPPHFMQLQPTLGHLAAYEGRVVRAELGEREIRPERVGDPEVLERQLFQGDTLLVEVGVEPRQRRTASLVSVYTFQQKEVFLLGVAADDVVLRLPYRAAHLRLTTPDIRLPGVLGNLEPGSRAEIRYWASALGLERGGACLHLHGTVPGAGQQAEADAHGRCGLRPTLGHGWALLYFVAGLPEAAQHGIHLLWILLVTVPAGLVVRRGRTAVGLAGAAGAAAWAAPVLLGSLAITPVGQVAMVGVGVGLGHLVRRSWLALVPRDETPLASRGRKPRNPGVPSP